MHSKLLECAKFKNKNKAQSLKIRMWWSLQRPTRSWLMAEGYVFMENEFLDNLFGFSYPPRQSYYMYVQHTCSTMMWWRFLRCIKNVKGESSSRVWNLPSISQDHDKILCWGPNSCWNSERWGGCWIEPQLDQIV